MDNDAMIAERWDVQKKLLSIVAQQQQHIENLFGCYHRLVELLRGEAGLEGRPLEQTKSEEELERTKAGLAELERLFAEDKTENEE